MHATPIAGAASPTAAVRLRRRLVSDALAVLDGWGYDEADVPLLSPYRHLRGAVGEDVDRELFRFVDRAGDLLYLRGDITPTLAWKAAQGLDPARLPLRLAYANRVARVQKDFAREELESFGVGFELVGAAGRSADLEALLIAVDLIESLGVHDYDLQLGHVRLAGGLADAHVGRREARHALLQAVAQRDAALVQALATAADVEDDAIDLLMSLCRMNPGAAELERLCRTGIPEVDAAAAHLAGLLDDLTQLGVGDRVRLDLSAVGERSYYTGIQFRLSSDSWGTPLGSGGRYDDLFGHFGVQAPAVGFGLRMDRIVRLLAPRPVAEPPPTIDVLANEQQPATDLAFALQARRQGERVLVRHRVSGAQEDAP